jgi:hypothetical protein
MTLPVYTRIGRRTPVGAGTGVLHRHCRARRQVKDVGSPAELVKRPALTTGTIPSVRLHAPEEVPVVPTCIPVPPSLHVEALLLADDGLTILASSEANSVRCPVCGQGTDLVHSRYSRSIADLPLVDATVRIQDRVRKFFCGNPAYPA